MNWKLPNQLTVGRIALAGVFFVLLGVYEPHDAGDGPSWLLNAAFVLYLIAGLTDVFDGYLARKMNVTSAFGRLVDPFVDKVLVVGAFAMLAGSNFAMSPPEHCTPATYEWQLPGWFTGGMFSGVQAWMVVVILAREFIVSAVRGYSESQGVKFPATPAGKIKMFVQSVGICVALFQIANVPDAPWAIWTKLLCIWLAVVVTVVSGLVYVSKARRLFVE